MTTKKRKLPTVGIFDPNLSQDPQFGNVSTLKDGLKRIHFHTSMEPDSQDGYYRHQIIIPECTIPTISGKEIDEVTRIKVPIIKRFEIQFAEGGKLEKQTNADLLIGLFEADKLSLGPFPDLDGQPGTEKLQPDEDTEAIFIMNKPAAYYQFENEDVNFVSNFSSRGYVFLQNYLNLFVGMQNLKLNERISFNAYIDYEICDTTYQDALVWQADFEKFIDHRLKYRCHIDATKNITIISRGGLESKYEDDPSDFPPFVRNTSKLFKVATRSVEEAAIPTKEVVWAQAMKKYYSETD